MVRDNSIAARCYLCHLTIYGMKGIVVKKASPADAGLLAAIARETFVESYGDKNTPENMADYLNTHFNDGTVLDELSNADCHILIAWEADVPVGYMKLNTGAEQTDLQETDSVEVERIYVRQAWQGRKVGHLLLEKAAETAGSLGKGSVWLGVWEENRGAIRFYERNGFIPFGTHVFMLGTDAQNDILMRRKL